MHIHDAIHMHVALLTTKDTKEILDLAWSYRANWKFIGIELGIDAGTLNAINADCAKVEECLREMIIIWLSNVNPKPTRGAITTALQSERVSNTAGNCISSHTYPNNNYLLLRPLCIIYLHLHALIHPP